MKDIRFSVIKNEELKKARGVTFEQLLSARLIDVLKHPKRAHQRLMLFEFDHYIWVIPYVEQKDHYFLKTAFPSRKYSRKYLGRE